MTVNKIAVAGTGYVGLSLATLLSQHNNVVAVDVVNETLSGDIPANIQWNISGNATDGYTFYPAGSATNYLYCGTTAVSSSNDNIKVGTGNTGRNKFKLTTKDDNYYLVTNDTYVARYVCLYNSSDWRGYVESSISQNNKNITNTTFYKKKVTTPANYEMSIAQHGGTDAGDGWERSKRF